MMAPQIIVRPEKRYDRFGKPHRGARRHDRERGRTLALLDTVGVTNRPIAVTLKLSIEGYQALVARAAELNVHIPGLAAYLVEAALQRKS